jgi:hypothetical protein
MALPFVPPLLMGARLRAQRAGVQVATRPVGRAVPAAEPRAGRHSPDGTLAFGHPAAVYNRWGSWVVLGCAIAWGALARRSGRFDRYAVAAVTYSLFLVLAPGFGIQYLVLLAPLLYVTTPRVANGYGLLAGGSCWRRTSSTGTAGCRCRRCSTGLSPAAGDDRHAAVAPAAWLRRRDGAPRRWAAARSARGSRRRRRRHAYFTRLR